MFKKMFNGQSFNKMIFTSTFPAMLKLAYFVLPFKKDSKL